MHTLKELLEEYQAALKHAASKKCEAKELFQKEVQALSNLGYEIELKIYTEYGGGYRTENICKPQNHDILIEFAKLIDQLEKFGISFDWEQKWIPQDPAEFEVSYADFEPGWGWGDPKIYKFPSKEKAVEFINYFKGTHDIIKAINFKI